MKNILGWIWSGLALAVAVSAYRTALAAQPSLALTALALVCVLAAKGPYEKRPE